MHRRVILNHSLERAFRLNSFFLLQSGKHEREKWVVQNILKLLDVPFHESDLRFTEEPFDITFGDAHFQIKELMDPGRKRGRDIQDILNKIINMKMSIRRMIKRDFEVDTLNNAIIDLFDKLIIKYPTSLRAKMDIAIYFNYTCFYSIEDNDLKTIRIPNNDFRTVIILFNNSKLVFAITNESPEIFKNATNRSIAR